MASVQEDVQVASVGDRALTMDIHYPDTGGPTWPVVVYIHGGGWRQGSNKNAPTRKLLPAGFVVACITYRFSNEVIFPAQIHDCKGAVRFLRAHADELKLDTERLGVWGHSAGGHLAALLGTTAGSKEHEGQTGGNLEYSSAVQAVADYFGPSDFLALAGPEAKIDHMREDSPESRLLGGPATSRPELARLASPAEFVSPDAPPFLIVHGNQDRLVPLDQSRRLHEALQSAGVESRLIVVENGGHGGWPDERPDADMARFFMKTLSKSTA